MYGCIVLSVISLIVYALSAVLFGASVLYEPVTTFMALLAVLIDFRNGMLNA